MGEETYSELMDIMLHEDDDALNEFMLLENDQDDILVAIDNDTTIMDYLLLFEEYLDNLDIYLYNGWEDAQIIDIPKIEKFWVTVILLLSPKSDLRGVDRIRDSSNQGKVNVRKSQDGYYLNIQILKRDLDQIDETNKDKINKLATDELDDLG